MHEARDHISRGPTEGPQSQPTATAGRRRR
jgi:hypothetical protein